MDLVMNFCCQHTDAMSYVAFILGGGGVQGGYWITNHEEIKFPFTVSR